MEIRQQRIDHSKTKPRINKQPRFRLPGKYEPGRALFRSPQSGSFQRADNGGANSQNWPPRGPSLMNTFRSLLGDLVILRMHGVIVSVSA